MRLKRLFFILALLCTMAQGKQDYVGLPQFCNRFRMRKIAKQMKLCAKPGLGNGLDNFGIDFAGQTNLQARSEIGGFGAQTGQRPP